MFINIEQNTPEWLEYRRSKFNASEAGDVMGVGGGFITPTSLATFVADDLIPPVLRCAAGAVHRAVVFSHFSNVFTVVLQMIVEANV